MRRTSLLVAAMIATAPALLAAQKRDLPSIPQQLSLADAVNLATQYNPALRQASNDMGGAEWGVRNAYSAFLPNVTLGGSIGYQGPGSQNFLSQQFTQPSGTLGSNYSLSLNWNLSGSTLMQPGLRKAQRNATEANIASTRINLRTQVEQQYLAVLQAQAQVAQQQVVVKQAEEALRLAQARYDVGQGTMLDVRTAQVTKGQADVGLLQAQQLVTVQKLTLFQQMGVAAPDDPSVVTLSDTFPVVAPHWNLQQLLADATAQNPDLNALRQQESSARWGARATTSTWFPSFNVSAGWSGYTQQYTSSDFLIQQQQAQATSQIANCEAENAIAGDANARLGTSLPIVPDCNVFAFTDARRQAIISQNSVFPFNFTKQPFSARLSVSLPIFNQFSTPLNVSEAQARSEDATEAVRARELAVRTQVSQAYYALLTAYQTVGLQDTNRIAAGEQLRLATERYRVGSGTFIDLLNGQVSSQRAQSDYVNAVYAYHRAVATLESAVGRSLR